MTSMAFARAFERNCPGAHLTGDEREELRRLFAECWKEASRQATENPSQTKGE